MREDLSGWTVVVTRPEAEHGPLSTRLRSLRASVLNVPTIEIGPPADPGPLDEACRTIDVYDWIVFTSARAVHAVASRLGGPSPSARIASVGPSTTRAVEEAGWSVDLEGPGTGAEALATALARRIGPADRLFLPASAIARSALSDALLPSGCSIDQVVAYETRVRAAETGARHAVAPRADAVTFTSPSAVDGWAALFGSDPRPSLSTARVVAIGDTTLSRLDDYGVAAHTAPEATFDGIVERLLDLRMESVA